MPITGTTEKRGWVNFGTFKNGNWVEKQFEISGAPMRPPRPGDGANFIGIPKRVDLDQSPRPLCLVRATWSGRPHHRSLMVTLEEAMAISERRLGGWVSPAKTRLRRGVPPSRAMSPLEHHEASIPRQRSSRSIGLT
jgi:hypothetical protein